MNKRQKNRALSIVAGQCPAAEPAPWFEVGLIPTTLADTGLGAKAPGSRVNLEVDVLAKYTERLLAFSGAAAGGAAVGAEGATA